MSYLHQKLLSVSLVSARNLIFYTSARTFRDNYGNEDINITNIRDYSFENLTNSEGKVALGRMRFAYANNFMGTTYIHIREFFEKDGEIRPGKKGISLRVQEWNRLKDNIDNIDQQIQELKLGGNME